MIKPEDCNLPAPPDLEYFDAVMHQLDQIWIETVHDLSLVRLEKELMKMRAIHAATKNSVRQSPALILWQRQRIENFLTQIIEFENNNQHE